MVNIRRRTDSRRREVDIGSESLVGWELVDPGRQMSDRAGLFVTESAPNRRTVSRDARCLFPANINQEGMNRITRATLHSSVRQIVTNRLRRSQEGASCL
jgi:hypothetical protein